MPGHDLKKDVWETWAFYPPGGWVGVRGASGAFTRGPKRDRLPGSRTFGVFDRRLACRYGEAATFPPVG